MDSTAFTELAPTAPAGAAGDVAAVPGSAPTQEAEELSFWDVVDIVNPLQHLPIIAPIYRAITGDTISAPARILGSGVFSGPLGMAGGLVNAVVERISGRDIGGHALALVLGDEAVPKTVYPAAGPDPSLLAEAEPATAPASQIATSADLPFDGDDVLAGGAGADSASLPPSLLPFTGPAPKAGAAADSDQPVWLGKALEDAQAVQQAQAGGQTFAPADTSWVSSAMMHALDKYQTLLDVRSDERTQDEDDARASAE